jgi:hypothetical protein
VRMREAKPVRFTSQGRAGEQGKAGHMREEWPVRCASQGRADAKGKDG